MAEGDELGTRQGQQRRYTKERALDRISDLYLRCTKGVESGLGPFYITQSVRT